MQPPIDRPKTEIFEKCLVSLAEWALADPNSSQHEREVLLGFLSRTRREHPQLFNQEKAHGQHN